MNISESGINLIKSFEGLRLQPYLCPAGVATIGYGCTHYANGETVTLDDDPITIRDADALLRGTLKSYEQAVNEVVTVPLTQGQFDALVSFAYNIGIGKLKGSTLLRKLNAGNYRGAAAEFDKWTHGGGQVLPGLVKRRAAEKALFLS
jgi:lysozyme